MTPIDGIDRVIHGGVHDGHGASLHRWRHGCDFGGAQRGLVPVGHGVGARGEAGDRQHDTEEQRAGEQPPVMVPV